MRQSFSPFVEYTISVHEYYMFEVHLLSSHRHKGTIDVKNIMAVGLALRWIYTISKKIEIRMNPKGDD
jgi:hypothetical protein